MENYKKYTLNEEKDTISAGILFADLYGSSNSKDDFVLGLVNEFVRDIKNKIKETIQPSFEKTWGDALLFVSNSPHSILYCAVSLLNDLKEFQRFISLSPKYKNNKELINDIKYLKFRIALHFGKFNIHKDNEQKIIDVSGKNINLCARIEAGIKNVVNDDGEGIYCTDAFYINEDIKRIIEQEKYHLKKRLIPLSKPIQGKENIIIDGWEISDQPINDEEITEKSYDINNIEHLFKTDEWKKTIDAIRNNVNGLPILTPKQNLLDKLKEIPKFESIDTYTNTQKEITINNVKQKLSDIIKELKKYYDIK